MMMECRKCRLSDIGRIVSGATPKTTDLDNFGGSIAWITPADLSGYRDKYISHGAKSITEKGYNSCSTQLMPAGSILFSSRAPIGYVAIAKNPVCTNQGFKSIIPDGCVDSEYLYYQLIYLRKHIQDLGSGTTFKEISAKKFAQVEVIVPPLLEQKRIVSRIEELFSQLDSGVETLKKAKQQLAVYRQAVLRDAFYQRENLQTVEMCELVDEIRIGPFGTALHKSDYITCGVPVINPQHIKDAAILPSHKVTISLEKAAELSAYKMQTNDIIMGRRGEMGRAAAVTENESGWICGTGSLILRLKKDYDACFYARVLSSPASVRYLEDHALGTTMKNLNESIVRHIPVPRVTRQMQGTVMAALEEKVSVCDSIERTIDDALQQAEALRQSILKKAFEGELYNEQRCN